MNSRTRKYLNLQRFSLGVLLKDGMATEQLTDHHGNGQPASRGNEGGGDVGGGFGVIRVVVHEEEERK